jgi:hypothetical protein
MYMRIWFGILVIVILLYIGCMLSNIMACTPLKKYWSESKSWRRTLHSYE